MVLYDVIEVADSNGAKIFAIPIRLKGHMTSQSGQNFWVRQNQIYSFAFLRTEISKMIFIFSIEIVFRVKNQWLVGVLVFQNFRSSSNAPFERAQKVLYNCIFTFSNFVHLRLNEGRGKTRRMDSGILPQWSGTFHKPNTFQSIPRLKMI